MRSVCCPSFVQVDSAAFHFTNEFLVPRDHRIESRKRSMGALRTAAPGVRKILSADRIDKDAWPPAAQIPKVALSIEIAHRQRLDLAIGIGFTGALRQPCFNVKIRHPAPYGETIARPGQSRDGDRCWMTRVVGAFDSLGVQAGIRPHRARDNEGHDDRNKPDGDEKPGLPDVPQCDLAASDDADQGKRNHAQSRITGGRPTRTAALG